MNPPNLPSTDRTRSSAALLVDRDSELAEVDRALDLAIAGEGRPVLVEGPPGIGKTSLLRATLERALLAGCEVRTARATELQREYPFGVIQQLFEPLLAAAEGEEREQLLAGAARLAETVFVPSQAGTVGAPPTDPDYGPLHGLYWLAANLADRRPVVLCIDDLQWIDIASVRFLEFLAPRLDGLAMLLVVATRSHEIGDDRRPPTPLAEHPDLCLIRPAPLTEAGAARVIHHRLDSTASEELCGACFSATGGNPFLLEELMREISHRGGILDPADVDTTGPERVGRWVMARLQQTGKSAGAIARAVAVLGDGADLGLAAGLAGESLEEAEQAVEALENAAILDRTRPLRFLHTIVRQAIYAQIPRAERLAAHSDAARLLLDQEAESHLVSAQLLAAGPIGEDWAVPVLRTAAAAALLRGAPRIAGEYLTRALDEPLSTPSRASVELDLGLACAAAGEEGSIDHLQRAYGLSADPVERATAGLNLAFLLEFGNQRDDALEIARAALEIAIEGAPDLVPRLQGALLLLSQGSTSQRRKVLPEMEAAIRLASELPDPPPALLAGAAMEQAVAGGDLAAAAELGERALAAGIISKLTADAPPVYLAIGSLVLAARFETALRWFDEALTDARRRGSGRGVALASAFRSWARIHRGDLAGAEADARMSLEMSGPGTVIEPVAVYSLALASAERGQLDEAVGALSQLRVTDHDLDHVLVQLFYFARGRISLSRGETDDALAAFASLERWERGWGACPDLWCQWRPYAAQAHDQRGDAEQAATLAQEGVERARASGLQQRLGVAVMAAAVVGPPAQAEAGLLSAIELLADPAARVEKARALVALGAALRRSDKPADAREPLAAALELAKAVGATAIADRAAEELRDAGGRPRRTELTGVAALTAAERRVAELAGDGLSNREIAQALFVTHKTVETHLGSVFRKLGISSRVQVAAHLSA